MLGSKMETIFSLKHAVERENIEKYRENRRYRYIDIEIVKDMGHEDKKISDLIDWLPKFTTPRI